MKFPKKSSSRRIDDARWFVEHRGRRYRVRPARFGEGPSHPDAGAVIAFYVLAPMLLVHVFGIINPRLTAEPSEAKAKAAFDAFAEAAGLAEYFRDLEIQALTWGKANGRMTWRRPTGEGGA